MTDNAVGVCADCADVEDFLPQYADEISEAARHIAYGIAHGGWACDHVDYDAEDVADAYKALWADEMRWRDRLRHALSDAVSQVGGSRVGYSPSPTHQAQVSVAAVERWRAALR